MRRNDVTPNHVLKKPCTMHITISRVRRPSPCPSTVSYTRCSSGPRNCATVCPSSLVQFTWYAHDMQVDNTSWAKLYA